MSANELFTVLNTMALGGWIALALFRRNRLVRDVICGIALPAVFAAVYVGILIAKGGESQGGFSSLPDVALLFSHPWVLLGGWVHYLAFDLLIGVWETRDAEARGIPLWILLPCLGLTFMLGPAGWLLYQVASRTRRPTAAAATAATGIRG